MRVLIAAALLAGLAYIADAQTTPPPACPALRACVSWNAPLTNTDGSPYTNPGGYRLVWGKSPTVLDQTTYVQNPAARTWTSPELAPGLWYFAVITFNAQGVEGGTSNVASKTIRAPGPTDGAIEAPTDGAIEPAP